MVSKKQMQSFQQEIFTWYAGNKRDLPWRRDREPYHILISEVMLQQTQVSRVIPKYEVWLKHFPTWKDLATAATRDVLLLWSGLGYNRRALYMQKSAQIIMEEYDCIVPQTEKELVRLPGIGTYTARALLCFGFDKQLAVVDTNIRKVIAVRFFEGVVPEEKILVEVATQLLPGGKAYEWNQALMDYAAAVLKQYKIPIPKQSKFKESDRFYRGAIIKLLLTKHKMATADVRKYFPKSSLMSERLSHILAGLEKDTFITFSPDRQVIYLRQ
ncbi:MAG TPA: Fe-S cluster assembly protein HesB [Patescibacteria group bacterium]|nr:Fe-S cluster assembly protein HesB [Patescibacteria group bacterium]